jgi:serine/threonine protein kinase
MAENDPEISDTPSDEEPESSDQPEISREVPTPSDETDEVSREVLNEDTSEIPEPSQEQLEQASPSGASVARGGGTLDSPERRAFQASMAADLEADVPEQLDPENLIGKTIDDRYRIEECIGAGGMAVVYRAYQEALDRDIVVKVLPKSFVDDEQAEARFQREARGMSQLEHPHVVSTYDFGRDGGVAYICMEYVEGRTLSDRIRQDPVRYDEFCTIVVQILQGIGDAHAMGMVHRDIKPANIMLCERRGFESYVKLLDFGLAKLLQGRNQEVTEEQNLVGSVSFLSPEQIMGKEIDERVDVYSLGVMFYYMLSGEKPFTADEDIQVLYQHVHSSPELLYNRLPEHTAVPEQQVNLIHRALSKDPENRPSDANALLEEFVAHVPSHALELPWTTGDVQTASSEGVGAELPRERPRGEARGHAGEHGDALVDSGSAERAAPDSSPTRVESPSESFGEDERSETGVSGTLLLAGLLITGGLGIFVILLTGSEGETPEQKVNRGEEANRAARETEESGEERESDHGSEAARTRKGTIRVEGVPGGRVFVDGDPLGSSPVETNVEPGDYQLEVRSDGEEVWEKSITLGGGDERTFRPSLEDETADETGPGTAARESTQTGGDSARPSSERRREESGRTSPDHRETGRGGSVAESGGARPSETQADESGSSEGDEQGAGEESPEPGGETGDSEASEETAEVESPEEPKSSTEPTAPAVGSSAESDDSTESSDSESDLLPAESSDNSSTSSSEDEGSGLLPVGD